MASEDDYFSRLECKKLILSHMEKGEWKSVLEYYDSKQTYREPNLVWIKPSLDMLQFIESCLIGYLGLKKITSIGCGCGTLEWLIDQGTNLEVRGLEVNSSWWEGSHATPHFIPLDYTEPGVIPKLDSKSALLFCYFNNLEYFHQYLNSYDGNCIILIGPVDGHRHCEPDPHYLKQISGWTLLDQHNIRNAFEDLVCIYIKQ